MILGETADGRKCKMTVFTTHTQAGPFLDVHKQHFIVLMEFMKYYNKKYLLEDDVIVASVLLGDFNVCPIQSRPDPETGKMAEYFEWPEIQKIFEDFEMTNWFYDEGQGAIRQRNIELLLQIQDLFYEQGRRVWEEQRRPREGTESDGRAMKRGKGKEEKKEWKMDVVRLIDVLSEWAASQESTEPKVSLSPPPLPNICCGALNSQNEQKCKS